jgi:2,3-bisphosphoglycerate-dependent phosphoglycerate mutase
MPKLILIRHGESQWNLENRFTGWVDVDLAPSGIKEAHEAGKRIKASGIEIKQAYSSVLKRAIKTLWIIQEELDSFWLPVTRSWRLNERHYGGLQGLNKRETEAKFGPEQVKLWRRSWDVPPPATSEEDRSKLAAEPKYRALKKEWIPSCESLKDTSARVAPFLEEELFPMLKKVDTVLIAAHGNSLRAIVKRLKNISDPDIVGLEIPTGKPWLFELSSDFNVLSDELWK